MMSSERLALKMAPHVIAMFGRREITAEEVTKEMYEYSACNRLLFSGPWGRYYPTLFADAYNALLPTLPEDVVNANSFVMIGNYLVLGNWRIVPPDADLPGGILPSQLRPAIFGTHEHDLAKWVVTEGNLGGLDVTLEKRTEFDTLSEAKRYIFQQIGLDVAVPEHTDFKLPGDPYDAMSPMFGDRVFEANAAGEFQVLPR